MPYFTLTSYMLVAFMSVASLNAQTQQQVARDAREIFETVLSPYCPGRTISNCPSPQADELRDRIRDDLASGKAPEDVKEELYAAFGDELRTIPRARGFALLAWVVPGLAFVIGAWAIVVWVRRTRMNQETQRDPEAIKLDPEMDARLAAELAELD